MKGKLHAKTRHQYGRSGLKASAIMSAPTDRRRADAKRVDDKQYAWNKLAWRHRTNKNATQRVKNTKHKTKRNPKNVVTTSATELRQEDCFLQGLSPATSLWSLPTETHYFASQTARRRFLIPSEWKEKYAICHHRSTLAHMPSNTARSPNQHP